MAEFTVFRDSIKNVCPTWLQGYWGYRFMYSIGIQLDAVAENLRQGVLARMPGYGTEDALPYVGNDRQILRGASESNEAFIVRLQTALTTWGTAGNAQAVISQLLGYVSPAVPRIRYVVEGLDDVGNPIADWVTVEDGSVSFYRASPSNWDWDGGDPNWRFWIIIYPGFFTVKTWNDGHFYNDGTSWGHTGPSTIASDMRALISKWKAAGSECVKIIVAFDSSDFDPTASPGAPMPDGTWGRNSKNVGGVQVPARNTNALYLKGVL